MVTSRVCQGQDNLLFFVVFTGSVSYVRSRFGIIVLRWVAYNLELKGNVRLSTTGTTVVAFVENQQDTVAGCRVQCQHVSHDKVEQSKTIYPRPPATIGSFWWAGGLPQPQWWV